MLLLAVVTEWKCWRCVSRVIKSANRKQQNTDNVRLFVENYDIKLEILNKLTHLGQSEREITVMSELFFCEGFSLVSIIITTIISNCPTLAKLRSQRLTRTKRFAGQSANSWLCLKCADWKMLMKLFVLQLTINFLCMMIPKVIRLIINEWQ